MGMIPSADCFAGSGGKRNMPQSWAFAQGSLKFATKDQDVVAALQRA